MKASIAHGIRPSALILGRDSGKAWGATDITLAKAYQRFLNELCQQCGLPRHLCHTDDNRVQFKLARDECAATALAEREQERMSGEKSKQYGVKVYGQPYLTEDAVAEGLEFSDFRRPYLMDRAKKLGFIPDEEE
jgi:hypothetical protein